MDFRKYETVELEIIEISGEDVIRTSNDLPTDDWGTPDQGGNANPN